MATACSCSVWVLFSHRGLNISVLTRRIGAPGNDRIRLDTLCLLHNIPNNADILVFVFLNPPEPASFDVLCNKHNVSNLILRYPCCHGLYGTTFQGCVRDPKTNFLYERHVQDKYPVQRWWTQLKDSLPGRISQGELVINWLPANSEQAPGWF